MNTTSHRWMTDALACMAQRYNQRRTVELFNALHILYDQQHQNRHRYQWRGGFVARHPFSEG